MGGSGGKSSTLKEQSKAGEIVTQVGFDVGLLIEWIESMRECGIDLPIRVGVPAPAGRETKTVLRT